jgi:hypothetical protein
MPNTILLSARMNKKQEVHSLSAKYLRGVSVEEDGK